MFDIRRLQRPALLSRAKLNDVALTTTAIRDMQMSQVLRNTTGSLEIQFTPSSQSDTLLAPLSPASTEKNFIQRSVERSSTAYKTRHDTARHE